MSKANLYVLFGLIVLVGLLTLPSCSKDNIIEESPKDEVILDETVEEVEKVEEKVAEFISFYAIRETANWKDTGLLSANPDGAETFIAFTLMEFELEDGTKVGKAVIKKVEQQRLLLLKNIYLKSWMWFSIKKLQNI